MDHAISAAEANRKFPAILRDVRGGVSYVVTSQGKPVARIIPYDEADAAKSAARTALLERLQSQTVGDIGSWTREELYRR